MLQRLLLAAQRHGMVHAAHAMLWRRELLCKGSPAHIRTGTRLAPPTSDWALQGIACPSKFDETTSFSSDFNPELQHVATENVQQTTRNGRNASRKIKRPR